METSKFVSELNGFDHIPGSRVLHNQTPMMRGDDVRWVQLRVGATPDGIFGPKTEQKVRFYQLANFLAPTGVVDNSTWIALSKESLPDGTYTTTGNGISNGNTQADDGHTRKTMILLGVAAIAAGVFIASGTGKK